MSDFYKTRMGTRFYEADVPRIAKALERIADALEASADSPKEVEREAKCGESICCEDPDCADKDGFACERDKPKPECLYLYVPYSRSYPQTWRFDSDAAAVERFKTCDSRSRATLYRIDPLAVVAEWTDNELEVA